MRLMKKIDVGICKERERRDPVPPFASHANGKRLARRSRPIRAFIRRGLLGGQNATARRHEDLFGNKFCMFFAFS
jgi:hypothetical protein